MNLQEQIGALEASVDDLIHAAAASVAAASTTSASAGTSAATASSAQTDAHADPVASGDVDSSRTDAHRDTQPQPADKPTLHIERPSQNEIAMTIGGQTVLLHPLQVGQLIEELSNARASMQPEAPANLPAGWRFVSTKNPMMAVQKQSNGDRLLVMRHTGHGWVPFTFSPDMVIQMYMMLTQA
ncbi:hypothetical protein [Paraburkholderia rhizosphaerae]|uniref:Phage tail protein n=1 Tax=Paraburkholderia rhizosphaerae TaxID=480658 RepID=A0A4R8M143_9BURK|nr:hypothetical protein [Paraburkholderia rhizosphaerae]TDY54840.1 hypothetical protein BX592_101296 [Paraburkholderia rhizosphaerae]